MEIISVKLDKNMLDVMDSSIKRYRYGTRTEFVRTALREKIENLERDELIKKFLALKGSAKSKLKNIDEQKIRDSITEEYIKKYSLQ